MTDEEICAYIDGELTAEEAATFEREAEADPILRARIEEFRRADALVIAAYEDVLQTPLPHGVKALFPVEAPESAATPGLWRTMLANPTVAVQTAAVAATVLIAGVWLWQPTSQGPMDSQGSELLIAEIEVGGAFHAALERGPSGASSAVSESAALIPILTFRDVDGRFCREGRLDASDAYTAFLACRSNGAWRIVAAFRVTDAGVSGQGYGTASAVDPIGPIIDGLIDGDPLDPEDEARLIRERWGD